MKRSKLHVALCQEFGSLENFVEWAQEINLKVMNGEDYERVLITMELVLSIETDHDTHLFATSLRSAIPNFFIAGPRAIV